MRVAPEIFPVSRLGGWSKVSLFDIVQDITCKFELESYTIIPSIPGFLPPVFKFTIIRQNGDTDPPGAANSTGEMW
jgi:hypothetical protein